MIPLFLCTAVLLLVLAIAAYKFRAKTLSRRRRIREEELAAQQALFAEVELVATSRALQKRRTANYSLTTQENGDPYMITVTETAKVQAKPDTVLAQITVSTREKSYRACQTHLDDKSTAISEAVKPLGLKALSIASSDFRIYPDYDNDRKIFNKGFNGEHGLTVKFAHESGAMDSFYTAVLNTESNASLDLTFLLDDVSAYRATAINNAIRRARETAEAAAQSAGITIGGVASIKPQIVVGTSRHHRFGGTEQFLMREAALRTAYEGGADASSSGPSIEAGELEIVASVTMRFRISQ